MALKEAVQAIDKDWIDIAELASFSDLYSIRGQLQELKSGMHNTATTIELL